jgi:hypothetical protein
MKNHIKNYIKIMGLAAVPFGTAQVHGEGDRILIKVEKYVLREGVYDIDIKVQQFCDGKLMHKSVIEYWWDEVSFKLKGSVDIFPKNNEGSSFRDRGKSVEGTGFLHGVIPGIIRDGTHIASFNAMDYSERDVSKRWLFTGCLFWFKRTFEDVMLVLCIDGGEPLRILSDVPVLVLKNCRNIPDNVVCGYDKTFRFADAESLVRGCSRPACLKTIPASLECFLLEELYFGTKEDYEKERRRLEEEVKRVEEEIAKRREEEMKKRRYSFYAEEEEEDDEGYVEIEEKLEPKPTPTQARIKALFEADRARREKDPELKKERMRREKAAINARNRIRDLIRIDLESRKIIKVIKEDEKTEKNEIILEEPKFEDKKEEKLFEGFSREDYFKGFDAFKENLSAEFKKNLKKDKSGKNAIKIEGKKSEEPEIFKSKDCFEFHESRFEFSEVGNPNQIKIEDKKEEEDKKEDAKINQSEITFGNKSLAESVYNDKSIEESDEFRSRKEKCLVSDDSED